MKVMFEQNLRRIWNETPCRSCTKYVLQMKLVLREPILVEEQRGQRGNITLNLIERREYFFELNP